MTVKPVRPGDVMHVAFSDEDENRFFAHLETLLAKHWRADQFPVDLAGTYRVLCHRGETGDWRGFWWDTVSALVLMRGSVRLAAIGFRTQGGIITVRQIQGAEGVTQYLRPLRWERILVEALVFLGQVAGRYREVRILSAHKTGWYGVSRKSYDRDFRQGMRRRYDGTARALGFRKHPSGDYWFKTIMPGRA